MSVADLDDMKQEQRADAKDAHVSHNATIDFYNQSAVEITVHAVKAILLINGGAAVAILGFVASVYGKEGVPALEMTEISGSVLWFGWGVLAAASCLALAYMVIYCQGTSAAAHKYIWEHPYVQPTRTSRIWLYASTFIQAAAVLVAIGSLVCFLKGISSVAEVISNISG